MEFNDHYKLRGLHAFLSASKYHWTNYSEEKLVKTYRNFHAAQRGTRLHDLACELIELHIKLPENETALNMFVNDAIGFRMMPEQPLFYSENAFGTADAISFRNKELRIHDLKTGISHVSMRQLEVYVALFCLEYKEDPKKISIELRVYQGGEIFTHDPERNDILEIMGKIVLFDKLINDIKGELE